LGNNDGEVFLFNIAEKKSIRKTSGHSGVNIDTGCSNDISAVCFSPDGRLALSDSYNLKKIWDVSSGIFMQTFEEDTIVVGKTFFSNDGACIVSFSRNKLLLYHLEYDIFFPGWHDWDDGALPYAQNFLALHPEYTKADFDSFIIELQHRGYGWLRPEGVQYKLDELQFG